MVIVRVPNRFYEGVIADVHFRNGEGHFEDAALAKQIADQFGFQLDSGEAEVVAEDVKVEKPKRTRTKKVSGE